MAKLTREQPYASIGDLTKYENLMLPRPYDDWRLLKNPVQGTINGLPTCTGWGLATNGVVILLKREDRFLFCHLKWFVADDFDAAEEEGLSVAHARRTPTLFKKFSIL